MLKSAPFRLLSIAFLLLASQYFWGNLHAQCPANVPYEDQAQALFTGHLAPTDTVWQSFVPVTTDSLQSIWLKFIDTQPIVVDTLRIFKGEGIDGNLLYQMPITISGGLQPFILDSAIFLDADSLYTFMLSADPSGDLIEPAYGCGFAFGPDIYPPGTSSFFDPVNKCELFFRTIMGGDDVQDPLITCTSATIPLDSLGNVSPLATDLTSSLTDNCTLDTLLLSQGNFDCGDTGMTNVVDLIIFDRTGNSDSCSATLIVEDQTPPEVLCLGGFVAYLDTTGVATLAASALATVIGDNCGFKRLFMLDSTLDCSNIGTPRRSHHLL